MKTTVILTLALLALALPAVVLHADDTPAANPPAANDDEENPAQPEGQPYDGAVNARDAEIKAFFDWLTGIERRTADLRAAVSGAATPDQKAQADGIRAELGAKKPFVDRWPNWVELEDFSNGLPNDRTAKFGDRNCRFAIGDFNEDGKPDLAAVSRDGDGFYAWLNNGDGTWTAARKNLDTSQFAGGTAVSADLNGDGHADLLFASPRAHLYAYKGDGAGNWEAIDTGVPDTFAYADVQCADVDGDKDIDIILSVSEEQKDENGRVLGTENKIIVLENDGAGKFTKKDLPVGTTPNAAPFVLADINNDGRMDFISLTTCITNNKDTGKPESVTVAIWLNQGDNTWALAPQRPSAPTLAFSTIVCADINGDGLPDLICAPSVGGTFPPEQEKHPPLIVYLNDKQGQWKEIDLNAPLESYSSLDVADVNGDGALDIVLLAFTNGKTALLLGDGKGGFNPSQSVMPSVDQSGVYLKVCDIDKDGAMDFVAYYIAPAGQNTLIPANIRTFRIWRNISVYPHIHARIEAVKKTLDEVK